MDYSEHIKKFIKDNIQCRNSALDLASGNKLRHAMIYKTLFKNVHACERIAWKNKISENGIDCNDVIMHWCDIKDVKTKNKFDLISFCWPEMAFYEYFFEETIKLKNKLNKNGKIIMIYRDLDTEQKENRYSFLWYKWFLVNDTQRVFLNNSEIDYFKDKGFKIEKVDRGKIEGYGKIKSIQNDIKENKFREHGRVQYSSQFDFPRFIGNLQKSSCML